MLICPFVDVLFSTDIEKFPGENPLEV